MSEEQSTDAAEQTVVDGGGSPDVATEQVVVDGGPLSVEHAREFPTAWHRDAHIAGLKREIEGARLKEDAEQVANAERELARLTGETPAKESRPRGAGKQTR